jgi:hypothetical protein
MKKPSLASLASLALCMAFALGGCQTGGGSTTGKVTGIVSDSAENPLEGVYASIVGSGYSATTDSSGSFSIEAPAGLVTLRFSLSGWTFSDITVRIRAGQTVTVSEGIIGYAPLGEDQYRIVLTWGELPVDLDSHLLLPSLEDVYFENETASDGSARLDWDDTDGFGPETITITTIKSGTYHYAVYNFDTDGTMRSISNAVVKVYDSDGIVGTVHITDASGEASSTDDWWDVLTIDDGLIHITNAMVPDQPGTVS